MQVLSNKSRIALLVWNKKETFNKEISEMLKLSMPTVIKNVNELKEQGIFQEVGVYESTNGRKARKLSVASDIVYAVGLDITKNHFNYVITNASGDIIYSNRFRCKFESTKEYYQNLNTVLLDLLSEHNIDKKKVLGIGIALPGILNCEKNMFIKSHILNVENIPLHTISSNFTFPVYYENDANSALFCEIQAGVQDAWYISLSNSVGGAFCLGGELYPGTTNHAGEIGHMIIQHNGKKCYCGKNGCLDSYCAASVLSDETEDNLDKFFSKVQAGDTYLEKILDDYLEYLAVAISNIRMCLNCDVILGGYVGACMEPYLENLRMKIQKYDIFQRDISYVRTCYAKRDAAALGGALYHLRKYFSGL